MAARKITGMHQREGSTNWYLRVMIPMALRDSFHGGRAFVRVSLNTADATVARTVALGIHQTYADTFARQQAQLQPMQQAVISPELADLLAQRARARILAMDDAIRFDPKALGAFLTVFTPEPLRFFTADHPPKPRTLVEIGKHGMTPEQLKTLGSIHDAIAMGLSSSIARGQLAYGEAEAALEARGLGLSADWSRNRPAVLTVLRAVINAWIDVGRRNLGEAVTTPEMPEPSEGLLPRADSPASSTAPRKSGGNLRTLWDVRDEWSVDKSKDAKAKMDRALRMLEASESWAPLEGLTRQHALGFRQHIQTAMKGSSSKTQSDVLANVQALINWAVKERGYLSVNPWAGTTIAKGKATKRDTWDNEDLEALLASDLHQTYALPSDPRGGRDAAYWLIPMDPLAFHRLKESQVTKD